ncbi:MAG: SUMF1/EgtB/PvdO family nonheme iron enzyme [Pirellulaceae bacterium]|jgi:formylglycine-generating enzyme required for sulfatase activity|nr:SUMF1/EgtB/PvdO family nonheme iron enzyme [Pirellulaceae bacterium]MDP7016652.1 SUMF1/EgtB/PvdO family nonheme iron enzyme [Pirellulaceae bacterium]
MPRSIGALCFLCALLIGWNVYGQLPPVVVPNSTAKTEQEMKSYSDVISYSRAKIEMVPIPGGKFAMGSRTGSPHRRDDEGPQREVEIEPFWMSKFEITWNSFEVYMSATDILRREVTGIEATPRDKFVDAVTRPTEPYTDMTFGMGKRGFPAICMTQHGARLYCEWLSAKTGRYYRLPTEAEWEYACRAGTTTAYSFGDDPARLGDYAWFESNSEEKTHKVGLKKPNPWGLYDMHGNVSEWVLDQYSPKGYKSRAAKNPLAIPTKLYPRVARGGGWDQTPDRLRSAARRASDESWKEQDPQEPQSIWYHTEALWLGFRVVRPLREPSDAEKKSKWGKTDPLQIDEEE